jgi:hypothetical protein
MTDSVESRSALYLRLLYSPRYADCARRSLEDDSHRLPQQTAELLRTLDFERLGIEQRARARNLAHQLGMSCKSLFALLSDDVRISLVRRFCDTEEFWTGRGRSLAENFCLVAFREFSERRERFLADVARLDGVLSGLVEAPGRPSPWPEVVGVAHERLELSDGGIGERFRSAFRLLDAAGRLPGPEHTEVVEGATPGSYLITVGIEPDRSVTVECEPC